MPRPAILALVGIALLAATFLLTTGAEEGTAPLPAVQPAPDPGAADPGTGPAPTPAQPPARKPRPRGVTGPGLPPEVQRAIERREVVVLFFADPSAADDRATRDAVRAVRRQTAGRNVTIFQDSAHNLAEYRRIVSAVGVSQIPAVVVVDRRRRARVFEGYQDTGSLRQHIEDAL